MKRYTPKNENLPPRQPTSVLLSEPLHARANEAAKVKGITLSEFIRRAIENEAGRTLPRQGARAA